MPPSARDIVLDHLAAAAPQFPDLPIGAPDTSALAPRDAGLARAIDAAVRRRWLTLEAVLAPCVARDLRGIEPPALAALLGGAAQLLLLSRVPDHAAVNDCVEWAKRRIRPGAGGFVNAVLRKLIGLRDAATLRPGDAAGPGRGDFPLDDGRILRFAQPILPEEPAMRLSAACSVAPGLIARWRDCYGLETTRRLGLRTIVPSGVVLNGTGARAATGTSDVDPALLPHRRPGFFVLDGEEPREALARHPLLWVQDPAAAAAIDGVAALAGPPPRLAVDLCAGRGTKSRQMASRWPEARILATDIDPVRFAALRSAFAGHPRVEVLAPGDLDRSVAAAGGAECVLLDVPCSNSGVLARRLEARYRFTAARLAELVAIQRTLLRSGAGLLAPGGTLVYATCSIEPEENQAQWAWAGEALRLRRVAADAMLPEGAPGDPPTALADGGAWAAFRA